MEGVPWRLSELVKTLGRAIGVSERRREPEPHIPVQEFTDLYWITDDGQRHQETAEVCSTSPKGMGILLSKPLPVNLTVMLVRAEDKPIKAVVRHWRRDTEGYRADLKLLPQEQRRFERPQVNEPGALHWSNPHGNERSSAVIIRDATPTGVQVEVPCQVPVASLVRLSRGDWRCFGFTCYCTPTEDRYLVGIHFSQDPYHKNAIEYKD